MIKVEIINKSYHGKSVIKDLSFTFSSKGFYTIVGSSGSGKSTLLNIIGSMETPDSGNLFLNSENITTAKQSTIDAYRAKYVGFIFQEYNLFEDYSVIDNIKMAVNESEDNLDKIESILIKLNLHDVKAKKVNTLSGGERQRVAIARALYKEAKIILADEPTGNLDQKNADNVMSILKELSYDILIICVTHDENMAKKYSNNTIMLRDGYIESCNEFDSIDVNDLKINNVSLKLSIKQELRYILFALEKNRKRIFRYFFILLFGMVFLAITLTLSRLDKIDVLSSTLKSEGLQTMIIKKTSDNIFNYHESFLSEDVKLLNDYHFNNFPYINLHFENSESNDSFYHSYRNNLVFGNNFTETDLYAGSLPKNDFDIVLTDYLALVLIKNSIEYENIVEIEELIGKTYDFYINKEHFSFTITGIIKTNYKLYSGSSRIPSSVFSDNKIHFFCNIYTTKATLAAVKARIKYHEMILNDNVQTRIYAILKYADYIEENVIAGEKGELLNNEVYITTSFLYRNSNYSYDEILKNSQEIYDKMNKSFVYTYYNLQKKLYIKGIVNDVNMQIDYYTLSFVVNEEQIFDFSDLTGIMVDEDAIDNLAELIDKSYNIYTKTSFYENLLKTIKIITSITFILFMIFIVFFISIIINYNLIRNEETIRTITILRSLGYNQRKLNGLLYKENFFIILISSLLFIFFSFIINFFTKKFILFEGLVSIGSEIISISSIILIILFYIVISYIIIWIINYKKASKTSINKMYKEISR
jgi:ABC-type lipoprotein export system ATPase subunit